MRHFIVLLLLLPIAVNASLSGLRDRLNSIIGEHDVSVALITASGDTLDIRGDEQREMASVMKFFQAVALTRVMSSESMLNDSIVIDVNDLHKNTWSPLRASAGTLPLTLPPVVVIDYSLAVSDNNAADILFDRYLSPTATDSIIRKDYKLSNFAIRHTEDEMHRNPELAANNHTSAKEATNLIYRFFTADTTASATVVKAVMSRETPFGAERIPAGISRNAAKIFHKTGTGFTDDKGRISAVNDLAFISYPRPQGYSCYSLGVFIDDFEGTKDEADKLIADISNEVWSAIIVDEFIALNKSTNNIPIKQGQKVTPIEDDSWKGALFEAVIECILDRALSD